MGPTDTLKKGLEKLQDQIRVCKASLEATLKANKTISAADEEWLDNVGNLVDEERLVDELERAMDYESAFEGLNPQEKSIVEKLMEIAMSDGKGGPGKKRNHRKNAQLVKTYKKENATLKQRIEILDWHYANGKIQTKTATHFNTVYPTLHLTQPRISDWIKQETRWQAEYEGSGGLSHSVKQTRQTQHPESGTTPSLIYDIDQLEAMRLVDEAWREMDTSTIWNCWRKAGILPDYQSNIPPIQPSLPISSLIHSISDSPCHDDPVLQAEKLVQSALDDLESSGVLQHTNRMNITELLNPAAESHNIFDATDMDIYNAVMDAQRAREPSAILGTSDNDDEEPVEPAPTRKEALQAALLLQKYTKGLDDPCARKVESVLSTFGQMTCTKESRSMRESKITSYFTRKV
ncbi:hypothetical protein BKA83DRAFT_4062974 [Pisolithus microcarpus]|nr:hypothetical protein BKA83DRAFT_4062974 [Pisolithus microcarpus]